MPKAQDTMLDDIFKVASGSMTLDAFLLKHEKKREDLPNLIDVLKHRASRKGMGTDCIPTTRDLLKQADAVALDDPNKVSMTLDGNTLIAEYTADKPTLDGLFKKCGLNKEDWIVEKVTPGSHQTPMKLKQSKGEHKAVVVTLHSLRATLKRRHPEAVCFPSITPIVSDITCERIVSGSAKRSGLKTALVLPDAHVGFTRAMRTGRLTPFHDRRALSLAVLMARERAFDAIVVLGDWLDLPDWSEKFVRRPEMQHLTQAALNECHYWLRLLREACPQAEIVFIPGNHDERLERAILNNIAAAHGLVSASEFGEDGKAPSLSIEGLLGLESLGINCAEQYPDGEYWLNDNLVCIHGDKAVADSPETSKRILSSCRASTIFGHIHRQEMAIKTMHRRDGVVTYKAHCPGCLCHIDGRVPGRTARQNWSQGLTTVEYEPGNGFFEMSPITITDGVAIWDGRKIAGEYDIDAIESFVGFSMEREL